MEGNMRRTTDNWHTWPFGENMHNVHPDAPDCPICWHSLLPLQCSYTSELSELWTFGCIECHTLYLVNRELSKTKATQLPTIHELLERIEKLEHTVSMLLQEREQQTQRSTFIQKRTVSVSVEEEQSTITDIPTRYRFLLNSK